MGRDEAMVCLGAIAGAFGIAGEVRLKSFCADPKAIAMYGTLESDAGEAYDVRLIKPVSGGFAARLSGVATKEAAEALKGTRLYAKRTRLPALPPEEYYYTDLIGLDAFDPGGSRIGQVRSVADHGAGDILEIDRNGMPELLVPFSHSNVPTVDIPAGRVVVIPLEDDEHD